jgi:hypothetical protein
MLMQRLEREHLMGKMSSRTKQYQKSEDVDLVAFYVLPLQIQTTKIQKYLKQNDLLDMSCVALQQKD